MKKLSLALLLVTLMALVACEKDKQEAATDAVPAATTEAAPAPAPEAAPADAPTEAPAEAHTEHEQH